MYEFVTTDALLPSDKTNCKCKFTDSLQESFFNRDPDPLQRSFDEKIDPIVRNKSLLGLRSELKLEKEKRKLTKIRKTRKSKYQSITSPD